MFDKDYKDCVIDNIGKKRNLKGVIKAYNVKIHYTPDSNSVSCPQCERKCVCKHGKTSKCIIDVDKAGNFVNIVCQIIRYNCKICGNTFNEYPHYINSDIKYTEDIKQRIFDLYNENNSLTYKELSKILGCSHGTISEICKQYFEFETQNQMERLPKAVDCSDLFLIERRYNRETIYFVAGLCNNQPVMLYATTYNKGVVIDESRDIVYEIIRNLKSTSALRVHCNFDDSIAFAIPIRFKNAQVIILWDSVKTLISNHIADDHLGAITYNEKCKYLNEIKSLFINKAGKVKAQDVDKWYNDITANAVQQTGILRRCQAGSSIQIVYDTLYNYADYASQSYLFRDKQKIFLDLVDEIIANAKLHKMSPEKLVYTLMKKAKIAKESFNSVSLMIPSMPQTTESYREAYYIDFKDALNLQ